MKTFYLRKEIPEDETKHVIIFSIPDEKSNNVCIAIRSTDHHLFKYKYRSFFENHFDDLDMLLIPGEPDQFVSKKIAREIWKNIKSKGFYQTYRFSRFQYENESLEAEYIAKNWDLLSEEQKKVELKKDELRHEKEQEMLINEYWHWKNDQDTGFEHENEDRGNTWTDDFMEATDEPKEFDD